MKNFALIGAAGYIAPKHLRAIKELGGQLTAALDPHDSVGLMDAFFPDASFFTEFERFDRHITLLKRQGKPIDYLSVCSPNYLHDAHIRFGLRNHCDVICEKPIVLNPWNIDALIDMERETNQKVFSILQLRLHPTVVSLKKRVEQAPKDKIFDIDLAYLTARGNWYYSSWKGNLNKSGGIATNIGVHFFDMLQWIFGDVKRNEVHLHEHDRAAGFLELSRARVRWFMSINKNTLPKEVISSGKSTYRSILIENEELEFSEGFTDLHTLSYQEITAGRGFRIDDTRAAIELVHQIRHQSPVGLKGDYHPLAVLPLAKHPFARD